MPSSGFRPPLLAADHIEQKTGRFIENRANQDVLGGCGAPPTAGEIRKIAEYLATLSPWITMNAGNTL